MEVSSSIMLEFSSRLISSDTVQNSFDLMISFIDVCVKFHDNISRIYLCLFLLIIFLLGI